MADDPDPQTLSLLRDFLDAPGHSDEALSLAAVCGFLFAVCCAPRPVAPSEWIPVVFEDHEPPGMDQGRDLLSALMTLYNHVNDRVRAGEPVLPAAVRVRDEPLANLEPGADLREWSRGYLKGSDFLRESWMALLPEELLEDLGTQVMILGAFVDRDRARQLYEEMADRDEAATLEEFVRQSLTLLLPATMRDHAYLGRTIAEVHAQNPDGGVAAPSEPLRTGPKTGRNEPCPCGSGKKYKKCCGK